MLWWIAVAIGVVVAIAVVNVQSANAAVTSISYAMSNNGNSVVLICLSTSAGVSAVSGLSGTWTHVKAEAQSTFQATDIWLGAACTGSGNITLTTGGSTAYKLLETSGMVTGAADATAGAPAAGPGTLNATITTLTANDLIVVGDSGQNDMTTPPASPWTSGILNNGTSAAAAGWAYQIVTSATTYTATFSGQTGFNRWAAAAFAPAAAPPSYIPQPRRSTTALHRAASYFSDVSWQERKSGLSVPGFADRLVIAGA